jgi:hypothetical protein
MFFLLQIIRHDRFTASSYFIVEEADSLEELITKHSKHDSSYHVVVSKNRNEISSEYTGYDSDERGCGSCIQFKELNPQDLKNIFTKMIDNVDFSSVKDLTNLANYLCSYKGPKKGKKKIDPLFVFPRE